MKITYHNITGNLALLLLLILLLSGKEPGRTITWEAGTKLTWKDFKDTLVSNSHIRAETASGFRVEFNAGAGDKMNIVVVSHMFPDQSWVDSTSKTDYLLSHEQYHFNITEYWARKLRKDIAGNKFTFKNIKQKISDLRKEALAGCRNMEVEYDTDSKHSMEKEQQMKWEKKVDGLLKSLDKYSGTSFSIIVK